MTFSLQVSNGDLTMNGSQLSVVANTDKLKQDLQLWFTERYGMDRFHPGMGSNFQNYIGGIINYHTHQMVQDEAMRLLDLYQKVQYRGLKEAPSVYSLAELLWEINDIKVAVGFDTVAVTVSVSNAQRQPTVFSVSQNP